MKIQVKVNAWYTCYTNEAEDAKIKAYAEKHGISREQAVYQLDDNGELYIMGNSFETDWDLTDVESCEEDFEQDFCLTCKVDCGSEPCPYCDNN